MPCTHRISNCNYPSSQKSCIVGAHPVADTCRNQRSKPATHRTRSNQRVAQAHWAATERRLSWHCTCVLCIEADTAGQGASTPGTRTSESVFRAKHSALTYRASSCAYVASGHLILLQHAWSELSSGGYLPLVPSTFASRLEASIR